MSDTEDRVHRVTWRSIPGATIAGGGYGEFLESLDVTAAYYRRDEGMVVFKKANGAITFTVAEPLVESIRIVEESGAKADGGVVSGGQSYVVGDGIPGIKVPPRRAVTDAGRVVVNVTGSAVSEADLAQVVRRGVLQHPRRNPPEATAC